MKKMLWAAFMRLTRVLVAQAITWGLSEYGNFVVPVVNISAGAAVNAAFKYLRDAYPKSTLLSWLPL